MTSCALKMGWSINYLGKTLLFASFFGVILSLIWQSRRRIFRLHKEVLESIHLLESFLIPIIQQINQVHSSFQKDLQYLNWFEWPCPQYPIMSPNFTFAKICHHCLTDESTSDFGGKNSGSNLWKLFLTLGLGYYSYFEIYNN